MWPDLLQQNLDEESAADEKLTTLTQSPASIRQRPNARTQTARSLRRAPLARCRPGSARRRCPNGISDCESQATPTPGSFRQRVCGSGMSRAWYLRALRFPLAHSIASLNGIASLRLRVMRDEPMCMTSAVRALARSFGATSTHRDSSWLQVDSSDAAAQT